MGASVRDDIAGRKAGYSGFKSKIGTRLTRQYAFFSDFIINSASFVSLWGLNLTLSLGSDIQLLILELLLCQQPLK